VDVPELLEAEYDNMQFEGSLFVEVGVNTVYGVASEVTVK
jgi:hypothetical protein